MVDWRSVEESSPLSDAYLVSEKLFDGLWAGAPLDPILTRLEGPFEKLEDEYPEWHPNSHSFQGMLKLFLYREISGWSYRRISRHPELAEVFGLENIPSESAMSRTWENRFNETTQEFITAAAHRLIRAVHDFEIITPKVRSPVEIEDDEPTIREDNEQNSQFTGSEIHQTTRLARSYGFDSFDSGRARNTQYDDTQFFELQTYMGMTGCGSAQGAPRFQRRRGNEKGPHGDTHLRTVKQFSTESLIEGFHEASGRLLSLLGAESGFREPATVAIDITKVPYYGQVEAMPMVSGDTDGEGRVFKYATLTIVGRNIPFILEVEPVRESSAWDENPSNRIHRTVRRLIQRAREHVNIEMVLCDAEFDSKHVFQTLSNLNVDYLIPTRVNAPEKEAIERMNDDGQEVAVEKSSVHLKNGSHSMRFLYVPSKNSDGTSVFATNVDVGPAEAKSLSRRYSSRWQIESEYKSIKHEFLAKTSSKDYRVRLFYFVFGALLHNIWRMTDFLLKAEVGGIEDGVFDRPPVLTAGETTELVSSALLPYG